MRKRRPKLTDEKLHDIWNVRSLSYRDGELQELDKFISSAVSRCLKEDQRNRREQAQALSLILGEEISVAMLDAYTSEARREHKISTSRFLALIAVTRRFDILDAVLREVGGKALDSQNARIFRVGVDYVASLDAARALRDGVENLNSPFQP